METPGAKHNKIIWKLWDCKIHINVSFPCTFMGRNGVRSKNHQELEREAEREAERAAERAALQRERQQEAELEAESDGETRTPVSWVLKVGIPLKCWWK